MLSLAALAAASPAAARERDSVELVVTLRAPSLADAASRDRALAAVTMRRSRVRLDSPSSIAYLQRLHREQSAVAVRIARAIPGAYVHWRYAITFDGLAVVVPSHAVARLARVPGVAKVWPSASYHASLDRTPQLIGAPAVWGPTLATAGQGIKIGIIDEGVDQTHPFFSPAGFTMPAGYPKGDVAFTTAKVIVAHAFAPPSPEWKYAKLPFDPEFSEHGTHVAGIAAGDHGTAAPFFASQPLSGIAPAAYIGNYKALTIPTPCCGLDGNAPEIAKAIEQAVADGMNVINLSIGEPEIEQSRDIVVRAIDGAARAGVVPCIAAGNEGESGKGTISSPGSAPLAITAAASTTGRNRPANIIASFSSIGPTPYSLQLKPDVTAPGVNVISSVPPRNFADFSGTSMASPHVAGAAALLKQQHPTWTVAQIKSALMQTGDPAYANEARTKEATPLNGGGGRRSGRLDGVAHARAGSAARRSGLHLGAGHTRRRRQDRGRRKGRRRNRLRHLAARLRDAKDSVLAARRASEAGQAREDAAEERHLLREHREGQGAREAVPLPGRGQRDRAFGAGTGLRAALEEGGGELRRPRGLGRTAGEGHAADRAQRRREPAHRVRRPAGRPQSLPGATGRRRRRRRRSPPGSRHVQHRVRLAGPQSRRQVHVPALDQRRHASGGEVARLLERRRDARRRRFRLRRRRGLTRCVRRRPPGGDYRGDVPQGHRVRAHRPARRQAHDRALRLRLPGSEEHGRRVAHPPEHARLYGELHSLIRRRRDLFAVVDRWQTRQVAFDAGGEVLERLL